MSADDIWRDIVLSLRNLRNNSTYAIVVVLTLGLGIAANTTIVSFMNPYLLRELPFGEPERLVQIGLRDPITGWDGARFSQPQIHDFTTRTRGFEDFAAYWYTTKNVTGEEGPERILAGVVSSNMFDVLQAEAALGRGFLSEEGGPAGSDVAVLSHGLWQRRYGADPGVLGREIPLDGVRYTIVGIMPEAFNFPFGGVKMWIPIRQDASTEARDRHLNILVGRLETGWTRDTARAELESIQAELGAKYPEIDGRFDGVSVKPIREALNFAYDVLVLSFLTLLVAVSFVLLIACVNVASLTLARASTRARDVAVRSALGASRARIVRQSLTESVLLAVAGGALGIVLSYWGAQAVGPLIPEDLFRIGDVTLDTTVLLYSLALTLTTPLVFGLAPAVRAARANLTDALKQGGRAGAVTLSGRRALVVLQVAMAIVLVGGTGLMLRSFLELQAVDIGFAPERVLTVEVTLPENDYPSPGEQQVFFDRAEDAVASIHGVRASGLVTPLPMNHELYTLQYARGDQAEQAAEEWPVAYQFAVSPGYFDAMGTALLAGRSFERSDKEDAPPVVIVSRSMAATLWPSGSPIGEVLLIGDPREPTTATVVGVVADIKHSGFENDPRGQVYRPLLQQPSRRRFVVVAAMGSPESVAGPTREALAAVDPNLPVSLRPMTEIVRESKVQWSAGSLLLGIFGAMALLLASLGIYGVVSYSVSQRRREMGIRMALGATNAKIRRLVLEEGLKMTSIGVGLGVLFAAVAAQLMASLLYGVSPSDPITFVSVISLFVVTAGVASLGPAWRASRTNPIGVLRQE